MIKEIHVAITGNSTYLQDFRIPGKDERSGKVLTFDGEGKAEATLEKKNLVDIDASVEVAESSAAIAQSSAASASADAEHIDAMSESFKHRLTGVMIEGLSGSEITLESDGLLHIPAMRVLYNKTIYWGDQTGDFEVVEFPEQTFACHAMTGTSGKVFYLSADIDGTISMQEEPVQPSDGATKCMLGSGFALYDADAGAWSFQAGAWKYKPWLPITGADARQAGSIVLSHALFVPGNDDTVSLSSFRMMSEGINAADPAAPSVKSFAAMSPWLFKYLYPGYDISTPMREGLDGKAVYDLDASALEDTEVEGKYAVYVPFATPAGQGIILPPQGHWAAGAWSCHYATISDAIAAIPEMSYDLTGLSSRLIPLGVAFVVKTNNIGPNTTFANLAITNTIPNQFANVNSSQIGLPGDSANLPLPPDYLTGFELSVDVDGRLVSAKGVARDATNAANIISGGPIVKTTEAWAVGNGNGGLCDGVELSADLKLYAIAMRRDDGAVEIALDDNAAGTHIATTAAIQAWGGE